MIDRSERVTIAFDVSLEELNDLRLAILESKIHHDNKELFLTIINGSERHAIIQASRFYLSRLAQEINAGAVDKDNLDVVNAIVDNICRLKSVLTNLSGRDTSDK